MSNAPHLLRVRAGVKFGAATMEDHMQLDGLFDAFDKVCLFFFFILTAALSLAQHAMGMCAEHCADKFGFTRAHQDEFALRSFARTTASANEGRFADEIIPIVLRDRAGDVTVSEDEGFRKLNASKVPTLRPAFKKDGSVTAANSSTINDGASSLVVASREFVDRVNAKPLARIVGFGDAAHAPIEFPTAPALAVPRALAMAGLSVKDIDYWEINEAFAVVVLANMKLLGLSVDRVNVNGGAVSMGHAIGSSGSRIIVTLLNVLKQRNARYGCATICNGGGGASAIVVENLQ